MRVYPEREENPALILNFIADDTQKSKNNTMMLEKNDQQKKDAPERDQWSHSIEFLFSCIAMSVGLGNVWRFPFTAYENGGGAFLIPYIITLIFVGKPLYYMELSMGQFASYGCVRVWEMVPAFRGIGYGQAFATWSVVTYYMSLMAQMIYYFIASFSPVLPWSKCPEDATHCIDSSTNVSSISFSYNESISASEIYYTKHVLNRSPYGLDKGMSAPRWHLALCLLGSWVLLFFVMVKGVKSSGKVAYFLALFPYVVLFAILGKGLTLPGAINGIQYFITPQWEKLLDVNVWYAAVGQSFFSLSIGFGSLFMMSSFNKFSHNVYRDATIISVTDTCTSILAGFATFAILGHLAYQMGVDDIDLVLKGGGSSLAFVSYPEVVARFQVVPQIFATIFFLMLFTLGVGSGSAMSGTCITIICDEFPHIRRSLVTLFVCTLGFFIGLLYVTPEGSYLLDLVDHYGGTFVIYILTFLEVIAVQWIYGYSNFIKDLEFMLERKTGCYWAFCWVFFIPSLLFVIFTYSLFEQKPLQSGDYVFGPGANGIGFMITFISLAFLPLCFAFVLKKNKKTSLSWTEALKKCFRPTSKWAPKNVELNKKYQIHLNTRKLEKDKLASTNEKI